MGSYWVVAMPIKYDIQGSGVVVLIKNTKVKDAKVQASGGKVEPASSTATVSASGRPVTPTSSTATVSASGRPVTPTSSTATVTSSYTTRVS